MGAPITIGLILGALSALVLGVMLWLAHHAPVGHQTEDEFHYGPEADCPICRGED